VPLQLLLNATFLDANPPFENTNGGNCLENQASIATECQYHQTTQETDWQPCIELLIPCKDPSEFWDDTRTHTNDNDVDKSKSATHSRSAGAVIWHLHLTMVIWTDIRTRLGLHVYNSLWVI
jgi:hypothetical protein